MTQKLVIIYSVKCDLEVCLNKHSAAKKRFTHSSLECSVVTYARDSNIEEKPKSYLLGGHEAHRLFHPY